MPRKKQPQSNKSTRKASVRKAAPKKVAKKASLKVGSNKDWVKSVSSQIKLKESYASLFLGILVVVIAIVLGGILLRNKGYTTNKNLNTATQSPVPSVKEEVRTYTVQDGEGLYEIAQKIYGDGEKWTKIAEANKIEKPDYVEPGTKLIIPRE